MAEVRKAGTGYVREPTVVPWKTVKEEEKQELRQLRQRRVPIVPEEAPVVGLAFSGGGIRSATINLGILQALAKYKLLNRIDYLSTVSGGGYIGGWLTRWIHQEGIGKVEQKLGDATHEPPPVVFLRDYSNYLTPRTGLLGADAWAAVATYARNLLLNQVILTTFLSSILLLPWILGSAFVFGSLLSVKGIVIGALAAAAIMFATGFGVVHASTCAGVDQTMRKEWTTQRYVLVGVALPLFVGALLLNFTIWREPTRWSEPTWSSWLLCLGTGIGVYTLGHLFGWTYSRAHFGENVRGVPKFRNVLWAVVCGAFAGVEIRLLSLVLDHWYGDPLRGKWEAVSWGPPLFVLAFLLAGGLHIGLAKFALHVETHEWWARLGGWLMLLAIFWAALFGLAIFLPLLAVKLNAYATGPLIWGKRAAIAAWLLHSGIGAKLGWSSKTSGTKRSQSVREIVAKLAPFVFVAGLMILLSVGVQQLALRVTDQLGAWPPPLDSGHHDNPDVDDRWWIAVSAVPTLSYIAICATFGALAWFLSWRVDINRFAMGLLYRNRLVRCYLGASNEKRDAQPFTGFDPADDVTLACIADRDTCRPDERKNAAELYSGPYPILNATLNVSHGSRLAWQERKAESFIFTPKFCGFDYPEMEEPTNRELADRRGANRGGYHRTQDWAMKDSGVTLGTAIATSGAAVSPNMGFHTFPPLAFLMTVFDVRLGTWLANPRFANEKFLQPLQKLVAMLVPQDNDAAAEKVVEAISPEGGPKTSLLYLLFELFGTTTDVSKYVYLTDGAHFENLALYELVRRQCDLIIASDAGEDGSYAFADLANAIRKCRTDLGTEIILDLAPVNGNTENGFAASHVVRGTILYPLEGGTRKEGKILYFKSCLTGNESNDVKDYRRLHPEFPQQSTGDQWFDESQFESYRALGFCAAESILSVANKNPASGFPGIADVFAAAPAKLPEKDQA